MQSIIFYTTVGCHLCEQAEELLQQMALEAELSWKKTDIADDPVLVESYGIRIPVLRRVDDEVELGWPFDLGQLREFVKGGNPKGVE